MSVRAVVVMNRRVRDFGGGSGVGIADAVVFASTDVAEVDWYRLPTIRAALINSFRGL
jgi:hypothetical protein